MLGEIAGCAGEWRVFQCRRTNRSDGLLNWRVRWVIFPHGRPIRSLPRADLADYPNGKIFLRPTDPRRALADLAEGRRVLVDAVGAAMASARAVRL